MKLPEAALALSGFASLLGIGPSAPARVDAPMVGFATVVAQDPETVRSGLYNYLASATFQPSIAPIDIAKMPDGSIRMDMTGAGGRKLMRVRASFAPSPTGQGTRVVARYEAQGLSDMICGEFGPGPFREEIGHKLREALGQIETSKSARFGLTMSALIFDAKARHEKRKLNP